MRLGFREGNEDETIAVESTVVLEKREGGRLKVRRAMRMRITMTTSTAWERLGKKVKL